MDHFQNFYESFFNNSVEGLIIFNLEGTIISMNQAALELFGYDPDCGPANIKLLVDTRFHQELWHICNSLAGKGRDGNVSKKLLVPGQVINGVPKVLGFYFNNHINTPGGKLIGAVVLDETQALKNEQELHHTLECMKKIFQNNPIPQLIVTACDHIVVDVNNKFLSLMGYDRDDVIGKNISETGIVPCPDYESPDHTLDKTDKCESIARRKNGGLINVSQYSGKIMVNDIPHEMWTIIDISAQKEAELHLKQLNEKLESRVKERTRDLVNMLEREKAMNDLKSRFVSTASHEFRTPLTSILVSTSLLKTYIQQQNPEKCEKHIVRIKSSVKILTEILEDFLSLEKIDQGQVKSQVTTFDIQEFADKVMEETEPVFKAGQSVVFSHSGNTVLTQDKKMLQNIITNLLSNASKYSPENATIEWTSSEENGKLVMQVKDPGIGIPEADKRYIFSRFFRARNAEIYQGTGLGLNIIKKYIELLNGKIGFESTENVGTTFTVELPLAKIP